MILLKIQIFLSKNVPFPVIVEWSRLEQKRYFIDYDKSKRTVET